MKVTGKSGVAATTPAFPLALAVLVFAMAAVSILYATRNGVGVSNDSVSYIQAARSLVAGHGLRVYKDLHTVPLTHFPPGYSLLLCLFGMTGIDPWQGARFLNALLFGASCLLSGYVVFRLTAGSRKAALLSCALVALSPNILFLHLMAWSEPPFLLLTLGALFCFCLSLQEERQAPFFFSALLAALALLTRYMGIVMPLTAVLCIFCLKKLPRKAKWRSALLYLLLSCLPMALWVVRNRLLTGASTDIEPTFHWIPFSYLMRAAHNTFRWFLPSYTPGVELFFALFVCGCYALWRFLKTDANRRSLQPSELQTLFYRVCGCYIAVYFAVMAFFILVYSLNIKFDERYLAPLWQIALLCLLMFAYTRYAQAEKSRLVRLIAGFTLLSFLGELLLTSSGMVSAVHSRGVRYSLTKWTHSAAIGAIQQLPRASMLYSNEDHAVFFLTHRPCIALPLEYNIHSERRNERYLEEMKQVSLSVPGYKKYIALFDIRKAKQIQPRLGITTTVAEDAESLLLRVP